MEVIGYKRSDFVGNDGVKITGFSIYLAYPLHGKDAEGHAVIKCYLSDSRLARCGYNSPPSLGENVEPTYNSRGKIIGIVSVD